MSTEINVIKPDPELIKQIDKVLEHNEMILRMNSKVLDAILNPPVVVDFDEPKK